MTSRLKGLSLCRRDNFIFVFLVFSSISIPVYFQQIAMAQSGTRSYFNSLYGISMEYPSYFTDLGPGSGWVASFTSTTGRASVFLNVESLPSYQDTLYSFVQSHIDSMSYLFPDFRCSSGCYPTDDTFGNYRAVSFQWSYNLGGRTWEGWKIWTLDQSGYVYSLSYLSPLQYFDSYVSDIGRMTASFRLGQ